jgi:hypothetical protein
MRALVLSIVALAGGSCSSAGGGGFRVVDASPAFLSTTAPVDGAYSFTFSQPVDPAKVADGAIAFRENDTLLTTSTSTSTSANGAVLSFRPADLLPYDLGFTIDLSGVRDLEGHALAASQASWPVRTPLGDFDFGQPLPRFVGHHVSAPALVTAISRLRSSEGHDYADDFETCRSMKHYFMFSAADWSTVPIHSPVDGRVVERYDEWAGAKLVIRSTEQHAFFFELFHVVSDALPVVGDVVTAGQLLGHHYGTQTYSDVAVGVQTAVDGPNDYIQGRRYVSYFAVLTDALFAEWVTRGVPSLDALVISAAERDANPLDCDPGGAFTSADALAAWVTLP